MRSHISLGLTLDGNGLPQAAGPEELKLMYESTCVTLATMYQTVIITIKRCLI